MDHPSLQQEHGCSAVSTPSNPRGPANHEPPLFPQLTHLLPRMLEPDCSWCSWCEVLTPSRRLMSARALPVFELGPAPITLSFSIWCWAICLGVAKTEKTETVPRTRPIATAVRKANPLLAYLSAAARGFYYLVPLPEFVWGWGMKGWEWGRRRRYTPVLLLPVLDVGRLLSVWTP